MKKKRFFCYRTHMGNMWDVLRKQLPAYVVEIVKEFWLVYSVDEFACFPTFQLFRATWKDVEITIQLVAGSLYSVKILY